MTTISKNFTLEELTASETAKAKGIKNTPNTQQVCNLCALVHHILQPLRDAIAEPIGISSGFRSVALNAAVGGASNSQHLKGEAADIDIKGNKSKGKQWFNYIKNNLPYDQLIWEHNKQGVYWIHVSHRADGKNRKQVISNLEK